MPKTLTSQTKRSFAKLAVLLFILAFLAATLHVTQPVRATSRFSCNLGTFDGTARTLSCGSSAGNFTIGCTGGVCIDETGTNQINQSIANGLCDEYERTGCPLPLTGDAFVPDPSMLTQ